MTHLGTQNNLSVQKKIINMKRFVRFLSQYDCIFFMAFYLLARIILKKKKIYFSFIKALAYFLKCFGAKPRFYWLFTLVQLQNLLAGGIPSLFSPWTLNYSSYLAPCEILIYSFPYGRLFAFLGTGLLTTILIAG